MNQLSPLIPVLREHAGLARAAAAVAMAQPWRMDATCRPDCRATPAEAGSTCLTCARRIDALGGTLLARGPEVLACVEAYWLRGEALDPGRVAVEFGIGINLAHALAAAVEGLDPHAPEVEIARVHAWLRERRPKAFGLPVAPAPGTGAIDDNAWFEAHPGRRHRVRESRGEWGVARRVVAAGLGERVAVLPLASPGTAGSEAEARDAFGEAAMAWLAASQDGPPVPSDVAWFASRPMRRHRIRPALDREMAGRGGSSWVTLVARVTDGTPARLCVEETSLPRSDRGEADLHRLIRERAADLAGAAALGLFDVAAPPVPAPAPARPGTLRARAAPGVGIEAGGPVEPPPEAPPVRLKARQVRDAVTVPFERWGDRQAARAHLAHWPCLNLDEALDMVEDLLLIHGANPLRAHDVHAACAHRAGGDGAAALATLKAYGLVLAGGDGRMRVTATARDGLSDDRQRKARALRRAAESPPAYQRALDSLGAAPELKAFATLPELAALTEAEAAVIHGPYVTAMAIRGAVGIPA